jgi:hypothetical protein
MDLYQTRIPAPQDWQQLQRITKDFYEYKYSGCSVDEYGTQGQAQDGVDVYVYDKNTAVAVQCKCVEDLTPADLRDEFNKTKKFNNRIQMYVVVVTIKRDTKLVDEAAALTLTNSREIRVEVKFWQAMAEEMADIDTLASKYLKFVARYPVLVEVDGATAHVTLETETSHYEFVVTNMASFSAKGRYQEGLLLVTSLQGKKLAGYNTLGGGHWTDFHGIVGCTKLDAFAAWLWFSRFNTFEELARTSGINQRILITEDEMNRLRRSNGTVD